MKTINIFILALFVIVGLGAKAQNPRNAALAFSEITFHSSPCNGVCPDISLNIGSDSSVRLIRTLYISRGVKDTIRSGAFKGTLDAKNFSKLVSLLNGIKWEDVKFPDITCCDLPVVQILLTRDEQMFRFRSMQPPASTKDLISFLTNLSTNLQLPRYKKAMDFDMILD